MVDKPLLQVKNLTTRFQLIKHTVTAVESVSFVMREKEILAIVGESGSGKSVTLLSILNLIENPGIIKKESEILFMGTNILKLSEKEIASIRGSQIAMIFQEPAASFNLLFSMGYQLGETLRVHKNWKKKQAIREAAKYLNDVYIPEPEKRVHDYPFQLSGGMLQRAMIAQSLICTPKLLLADEPTSSLDVTIQAQILKLLKELSQSSGMAILFVTHDIELINGFADNVIIMYAGRVLEYCSVNDIIKGPLHPYTKDLFSAIPRLGYFKDEKKLYSIKGNVPEPYNFPSGCKYHPRCSQCFDQCLKKEPPLYVIKEKRKVCCWLFQGEKQIDEK